MLAIMLLSKRIAALALPVLLLVSCAGLQPGRQAAGLPEEWVGREEAVARRQEALVTGAKELLGRQELVVRGRRFNMDCTGVVLAVYYWAGMDLSRDLARYSGNGVTRLYKSLESRDLLYRTRDPAPGDIIFWDNTYDRNGDGRFNDALTHTGMVVNTHPDGGIEYIHLNYRRGIILEAMNLHHPDAYQDTRRGKVTIVNSPMRMKEAGKPHPDKWLASQLYRVFGKGYLTGS
jgi:hypothetical protein